MEITIHGVVRMFIWLVSLGGFFYQTSTMLEMYFKYPFSVTVVEQLQKGILFPAVTICVENWINKTRFCEIKGGDCLEDQHIDENHFAIEYDFQLQNDVSLLPNEVMECYMRSNDPTCPAFTCFEAVRRSYYRHPAHMCYTFDILVNEEKRPFYDNCKSPWTWELTLNVVWRLDKTLSLIKEASFPVIIHRPETTPPDKLSSIIAEAGNSYVLSVTQQGTKRLPPPYASQCTDYVNQGMNLDMGGIQSQDTCIQKCRMALEYKHCGCISPLYEYSAYYGKTACTQEQLKKCDDDLMSNNTFGVCTTRCRAPCDETTYDVRLTGMAVIPPEFNNGAEKFYIRVKFSSDTQKTFLYQPKLSIVEAFGYLGGYLGMWLGFSLYSILSGLEEKFQAFLTRRSQKSKTTIPDSTPVKRINHDSDSIGNINTDYNDKIRRRFMVRPYDPAPNSVSTLY